MSGPADGISTRRRRPLWPAIAALSLLPVLMAGLTALLIWRSEQDISRANEVRLAAAVRVVSAEARALVGGHHDVLERFAETLGPDPSRWTSRPAPAWNAREGSAQTSYVFVFDAAGVLRLPEELATAGGLTIRDRGYFQELASGAARTVSPLILQSATGGPVFAVARRLESGGGFAGAAIVFVPADSLEDSWSALDLGANSTVGLMRTDGQLVARYPVPDQVTDMSGHALFTEHLPRSPSGIYSSASSPVDSHMRLVAYQTLEQLPLVATASMSAEMLEENMWRRIRATVLAAAPFTIVLIGLCVGMAMLLVEHQRSRRALEVAARQNEMLLQEIHHRIKNNLQTVAAMIRLQPGDQENKNELARRIQAMTALHQLMYESNRFDQLDARDYLGRLLATLREGQRADVVIETEVASLTLTADQVQPLGLIITEVVGNAFKHAFPDGRAGVIRVTLNQVAGGQAELSIVDNGVGYEVTSKSGMGTRLVRGLASQLGGELQQTSVDGARFVLRFPLVAPAV